MDLKKTNIRLIQASNACTGSTVLVNILQGLFDYEKKIWFFFRVSKEKLTKAFLNSFIIKTHKQDIDEIINNYYGNTFDYWIISSNRGNKIYSCKHPNCISFEYEQLVETTTNSIETIVNTVAQKLKTALPNNITNQMDINASIQRIKNMNALYEQIKNQPFRYANWPERKSQEVQTLVSMAQFYEIHGQHRNRKKL